MLIYQIFHLWLMIQNSIFVPIVITQQDISYIQLKKQHKFHDKGYIFRL